MNDALLSSKRMDWQTPPEILALVEKVAPIMLDPCPPNHIVDGLTTSWRTNDGLTYVNPPYGRELGQWIKKAMVEADNGAEIIMLIPARPDTRYWQDFILPFARAVCFWRGRIKFVGADAPAPFPSAFVYWGKRNEDKFIEVFTKRGFVV